MDIQLTKTLIGQIKESAQSEASNWDGETTKGEREAEIHSDIVEACNNLLELLSELDEESESEPIEDIPNFEGTNEALSKLKIR